MSWWATTDKAKINQDQVETDDYSLTKYVSKQYYIISVFSIAPDLYLINT